MLGALDPAQLKVTIIGGGASGLFAAYHLLKAGYQPCVYESSGRFGGLLATKASDLGLVEAAANSLVWTPELQRLCDEIGLTLEELAPDAHAKFILRGNRLRRFPLNFLESLSFIWHLLFVRSEGEGTDCRTFALTHWGRAAADYLIEPMVTGIYGAKAASLSQPLCFPTLTIPKGKSFLMHLFTRRKSTVAKRRIVAPLGGMQAFIDKLVTYLSVQNVPLHLNSAVTYDRKGNTIVATNAPRAASLLKDVHPDLAALLSNVIYTPMISMGVFVDAKSLRVVPKGLGVLIPAKEGSHLLGILFSSSAFPSHVRSTSHTLWTVMLGGEHHPELLELSDQELERLVLRELRALFGAEAQLLAAVINRWPQAIPLYSLAHAETLAKLQARLAEQKGLVLFGSYSGEVSLRGMLTSASNLARPRATAY